MVLTGRTVPVLQGQQGESALLHWLTQVQPAAHAEVAVEEVALAEALEGMVELLERTAQLAPSDVVEVGAVEMAVLAAMAATDMRSSGSSAKKLLGRLYKHGTSGCNFL